MPEARVNGTILHFDRQGSGEPLVMIPFLTADHACFAFQTPAYVDDFSCYAVDVRGSGASPSGDRPCTMKQFADDLAAFMDAEGIPAAHVYGFSLGGAVAMTFAAAFPDRTLSVSLHSCWPRSDAYLRTVVEGWKVAARALGDVAETAIQIIFPWCFMPEVYAAQPDFIASLADFARSRPKQSLEDFLAHADAVIAHDALADLARIKAPTQISFGSGDVVTSTRFLEPMRQAIPHAEVEIFENCSHAPFFEATEAFNARTLAFLKRHRGRAAVRREGEASKPRPVQPA